MMRSALLLLTAAITVPAAAQDRGAAQDAAEPRTRTVLLGGVADWRPAFPGADTRDLGFFPLIAVWNEGERMPVETPDESFGINFIGDDEGTSAGIVASFSPRRRPRDVGLDVRKVGFGVEAGGFVQSWIGDHLRLRGELRQGIGGHEALTADLSADAVYRDRGDNIMLTAGPRVRWASGGYNRAYFGVTAEEALATGLAAYRPGSGIHAVGAVASAHVHMTPAIGIYGYGGYDRLVGDAARSPLVRSVGSRDQLSFGIGLSYRFSVTRRSRSERGPN